MKRWLHLMAYAVRHQRARRALRQSNDRAARVRAEYGQLGHELRQALRAKADAEVRLIETIRQK